MLLQRKVIALELKKRYAPGTYFIKCLGEGFEQNFKVIKM